MNDQAIDTLTANDFSPVNAEHIDGSNIVRLFDGNREARIELDLEAPPAGQRDAAPGQLLNAIWDLLGEKSSTAPALAAKILRGLRAGLEHVGPDDEELRKAYLIAHPEGPPFEPVNFMTLVEQRPERGPVVIDGSLREAAVGTLIGGTKTHKSFAVAALIAATLSGGTWFGQNVAQGRVALIDGELTLGTIYFRLRKVFEALGLDPAAIGRGLDVYNLRGRTKEAPRAIAAIRAKGPGYYKLVVVDPLYCFYPADPRFSENDNAGMRRVYDDIIALAVEIVAAIMVIHHLSKGGQSEKGLTDLGSGAGAISRAGDAHLAFRQHAEKGAVVFDGVVRDFPELVPTVWRWSFPLFVHAPDLSADDLVGKKKRKSDTTDFLADAKPVWTAKSFAARFIGADGRTLPHIEALAGEEHISPNAAKRFTEQAIALNLAYTWPGKTGRNGTPNRFANVECPVTECGRPTPKKNE